MQLSATINTSKLTRDLRLWQKTVVPMAIAKALTFTAKKAIQPELIREMSRVFDRPTRFTLNSTFIKAATPATMEARVKIKDEAFKSLPSLAVLGHHITGGFRVLKRSEILLRQQGILGGDEYIVPGQGAKLDAHGNISRGQMQQILSRVGASFDALSRAKGKVSRAKGRAYSETYFAVTTPGRLQRGIYRRVIFAAGSAVQPVLIFVRRPRYRKRFDFFRISEQVFQLRYPLQLKQELERAIRAKAATHLI